jgi:hypothetical protein
LTNNIESTGKTLLSYKENPNEPKTQCHLPKETVPEKKCIPPDKQEKRRTNLAKRDHSSAKSRTFKH